MAMTKLAAVTLALLRGELIDPGIGEEVWDEDDAEELPRTS